MGIGSTRRHAAASLTIAVIAGAFAIGCEPQGPAAPAGGGAPAGVQWQDYNPALQSQLDQLKAGKDCPGLQTQFNAADANSTATMSRTGHSNAELMGYIDAAMRSAGCY